MKSLRHLSRGNSLFFPSYRPRTGSATGRDLNFEPDLQPFMTSTVQHEQPSIRDLADKVGALELKTITPIDLFQRNQHQAYQRPKIVFNIIERLQHLGVLSEKQQPAAEQHQVSAGTSAAAEKDVIVIDDDSENDVEVVDMHDKEFAVKEKIPTAQGENHGKTVLEVEKMTMNNTAGDVVLAGGVDNRQNELSAAPSSIERTEISIESSIAAAPTMEKDEISHTVPNVSTTTAMEHTARETSSRADLTVPGRSQDFSQPYFDAISQPSMFSVMQENVEQLQVSDTSVVETNVASQVVSNEPNTSLDTQSSVQEVGSNCILVHATPLQKQECDRIKMEARATVPHKTRRLFERALETLLYPGSVLPGMNRADSGGAKLLAIDRLIDKIEERNQVFNIAIVTYSQEFEEYLITHCRKRVYRVDRLSSLTSEPGQETAYGICFRTAKTATLPWTTVPDVDLCIVADVRVLPNYPGLTKFKLADGRPTPTLWLVTEGSVEQTAYECACAYNIDNPGQRGWVQLCIAYPYLKLRLAIDNNWPPETESVNMSEVAVQKLYDAMMQCKQQPSTTTSQQPVSQTTTETVEKPVEDVAEIISIDDVPPTSASPSDVNASHTVPRPPSLPPPAQIGERSMNDLNNMLELLHSSDSAMDHVQRAIEVAEWAMGRASYAQTRMRSSPMNALTQQSDDVQAPETETEPAEAASDKLEKKKDKAISITEDDARIERRKDLPESENVDTTSAVEITAQMKQSAVNHAVAVIQPERNMPEEGDHDGRASTAEEEVTMEQADNFTERKGAEGRASDQEKALNASKEETAGITMGIEELTISEKTKNTLGKEDTEFVSATEDSAQVVQTEEDQAQTQRYETQPAAHVPQAEETTVISEHESTAIPPSTKDNTAAKETKERLEEANEEIDLNTVDESTVPGTEEDDKARGTDGLQQVEEMAETIEQEVPGAKPQKEDTERAEQTRDTIEAGDGGIATLPNDTTSAQQRMKAVERIPPDEDTTQTERTDKAMESQQELPSQSAEPVQEAAEKRDALDVPGHGKETPTDLAKDAVDKQANERVPATQDTNPPQRTANDMETEQSSLKRPGSPVRSVKPAKKQKDLQSTPASEPVQNTSLENTPQHISQDTPMSDAPAAISTTATVRKPLQRIPGKNVARRSRKHVHGVTRAQSMEIQKTHLAEPISTETSATSSTTDTSSEHIRDDTSTRSVSPSTSQRSSYSEASSQSGSTGEFGKYRPVTALFNAPMLRRIWKKASGPKPERALSSFSSSLIDMDIQQVVSSLSADEPSWNPSDIEHELQDLRSHFNQQIEDILIEVDNRLKRVAFEYKEKAVQTLKNHHPHDDQPPNM